MKIITWNVNSVRSRLERLLALLERDKPDVLCLQELKSREEDFPYSPLGDAGYHAAVFGQKTYNGVAILAREEPRSVQCGFRDEDSDPQARMIEVRVGGVRVLCLYVPNGAEVASEKFSYKLEWLRRLRRYLDQSCHPSEPLLLCGDFNIAPDDRDVPDPAKWNDTVLCVPEVRACWSEILGWGLVDLFRLHHDEAGLYTWWDYRRLGFPRNEGLRIDHILGTHSLARRCVSASIDRNERKGQKPSDHATLQVVLED